MKLTARRLPAVSVVSVAAVGPYEMTTQEAWEHLQHLLVKHGARGLAKPVFALLRDMPHEVRAEERRLELCAPVNASALKSMAGEATIQMFTGGAYLTTTHRGSYQKLPQMFSQMYAACSLDMNITLDTKRPRVILFNGDPTVVPPHDLVAALGMPVIDHSAELPNRAD
jgi:DNA gyrase inhibitor GyrI